MSAARLIHSALGNNDDANAAGWGGRWNGRTALHAQASPTAPTANSSAPGSTTVGNTPKRAAGFGAPTAAAGAPPPFFISVQTAPAMLHAPPWVVDALLLAGDLTVIAGQGGGAKTAFAVMLAVALAAGLSRIGPFVIRQQPDGLRFAYISAEEDPNRLGLLVAAAGMVLRLDATEQAAVRRNLLLHDARASGWKLGTSASGNHQAIAPEAADSAFATLRAGLAASRPAVVIFDTMAAVVALPNENDNSAVTALMNRFARAAAEFNCAMMLLHHTPKMTRESAAAQRGEATLVRGGGAITNSARVVYTIAGLSEAETGSFALTGAPVDRIRRVDAVKINDMLPPAPAYFQTTSAQVQVSDGTYVDVRAVEFLQQLATVVSGGTPTAIKNLAMVTIDKGTTDDIGAKVPLSPGGGRNNTRDARKHIAHALRANNPALSEVHAEAAAKAMLKELLQIGCVVTEEVQVPAYKDGKPNGNRKAQGLVCRWYLAPWVAQQVPQQVPQQPVAVVPPAPASGLTSAPNSTADGTASVTQQPPQQLPVPPPVRVGATPGGGP